MPRKRMKSKPANTVYENPEVSTLPLVSEPSFQSPTAISVVLRPAATPPYQWPGSTAAKAVPAVTAHMSHAPSATILPTCRKVMVLLCRPGMGSPPADFARATPRRETKATEAAGAAAESDL